MKKKIVFISGLGGTGKSTIVDYFLQHPIDNFTFFDFDKGKYKAPLYDENHLEWRKKQTEWWLDVASESITTKNNIAVIVGLSLYPSQILQLPNSAVFGKENIYFGHLTCNASIRKDRLHDRGDSHHWQGHKQWYDEFFEEMNRINAFEIDTSHSIIEETAKTIQNWLINSVNKLENEIE